MSYKSNHEVIIYNITYKEAKEIAEYFRNLNNNKLQLEKYCDDFSNDYLRCASYKEDTATKWYTDDRDLTDLSVKYPNAIIVLDSIGEDWWYDITRVIYFNGTKDKKQVQFSSPENETIMHALNQRNMDMLMNGVVW